MKTFFILAGLCVALTGQAQIEESGWFNADGSVTAETPSGGFSEGGAGFSGSATAIAEVITPEIEALARGLGNDPVRIFNYVHDHIRHVLYFGSKKGAHLTLLERSGNDFDQSALLVALLRAAGFSPSYQFGFLRMPFDSADHRDVRHWLQLTVPNTNWTTTDSYFSLLLGVRGYPTYFNLNPIVSSNIGIQRVWVKLGIGGTNYLLDPAFKVSEPFTGLNLASAMSLDTNALLSAAGGTATADSRPFTPWCGSSRSSDGRGREDPGRSGLRWRGWQTPNSKLQTPTNPQRAAEFLTADERGWTQMKGGGTGH